MRETLNSRQKAVVVFLRLNTASRKAMLERLSDADIKQLFNSMKEIGTLEAAASQEVCDEFSTFLKDESGVVGEAKLAQDILNESLEPSRLEAMNLKEDTAFGRLNSLPETLLAEHFQKERPQVVALILSRLEEEKAAALLGVFEVNFARDVILASLNTKPLTPQTLDTLSQAVEKTMLKNLENNDKTHILARLTRMIEKQEPPLTLTLLEEIERRDKSAAKAIAAKIFTFSHLELLSARDLTHVLNTAGHSLTAQCLTPLSQDKQEFYLHHVSEKAAEYILEEMELGRPNAQAQRDIVSLARKLEGAGEIELHYA